MSKSSVLFDRWFLGASLLGSLVMGLLATYGTLTVQVAMTGTVVSIMCGLTLTVMQEFDRFRQESKIALQELGLILSLTGDSVLRGSYDDFIAALGAIKNSRAPIFRTLARERMTSLNSEYRNLANQRLEYVGTEAWRSAYAEVLQSANIKEYCSVAWVRSCNYWQDQPGLQSLRLNCELAERGVVVKRVIIQRKDAAGEETRNSDSEQITSWMRMQHKAGIRVLRVDEESLAGEEDLLDDFGIYGKTAVGILNSDDTSSRTLRFRLSFDPVDLKVYREKWERLLLYATEWHPSEPNESL